MKIKKIEPREETRMYVRTSKGKRQQEVRRLESTKRLLAYEPLTFATELHDGVK